MHGRAGLYILIIVVIVLIIAMLFVPEKDRTETDRLAEKQEIREKVRRPGKDDR